MKSIRNVRKVNGALIRKAYDASHAWFPWSCQKRVPDSAHLFNFDVELRRDKELLSRRILVLDPYGEETLTGTLRRHVLGARYGANTIGVDRQTGLVLVVAFLREKGKAVMAFSPFGPQYMNMRGPEYVLPLKYVARLDEVKSKKRPYTISVQDYALVSFIERDYGFSNLTENLTIRFDFDGVNVEVFGDRYREVSDWKGKHE